jgi:hypothetical protein
MACDYHVQSIPGSLPYVGNNFNLLFVGTNVMQTEDKQRWRKLKKLVMMQDEPTNDSGR